MNKQAVYLVKYHQITYWTSHNTSTTKNCESKKQAQAIIIHSGISQELIIN